MYELVIIPNIMKYDTLHIQIEKKTLTDIFCYVSSNI